MRGTFKIIQPTILKPSTAQSSTLSKESLVNLPIGQLSIQDCTEEAGHYKVQLSDGRKGYIYKGHCEFKPATSAGSLNLGSDLASRIIRTMQQLGMHFDSEPSCINIVYLEGVNPNGEVNADRMNEWNDLRTVISFRDGKPQILGCWLATTEPGWKYTAAPLNPDGAFRIAFGQYKAWRVGTHKDHEALEQCAEIEGHRDHNKDGKRTGDKVVRGSGYGVNQHHGWNMARIDGASAGCLVGQSVEGHRAFMALIKTDSRYKQNHGYVFRTAVLDGSKI